MAREKTQTYNGLISKKQVNNIASLVEQARKEKPKNQLTSNTEAIHNLSEIVIYRNDLNKLQERANFKLENLGGLAILTNKNKDVNIQFKIIEPEKTPKSDDSNLRVIITEINKQLTYNENGILINNVVEIDAKVLRTYNEDFYSTTQKAFIALEEWLDYISRITIKITDTQNLTLLNVRLIDKIQRSGKTSYSLIFARGDETNAFNYSPLFFKYKTNSPEYLLSLNNYSSYTSRLDNLIWWNCRQTAQHKEILEKGYFIIKYDTLERELNLKDREEAKADPKKLILERALFKAVDECNKLQEHKARATQDKLINQRRKQAEKENWNAEKLINEENKIINLARDYKIFLQDKRETKKKEISRNENFNNIYNNLELRVYFNKNCLINDVLPDNKKLEKDSK